MPKNGIDGRRRTLTAEQHARSSALYAENAQVIYMISAKYAKRFSRFPDVDFHELVNVGRAAAFRAAWRFDPAEFKFSTFIHRRIQGGIIDHLRETRHFLSGGRKSKRHEGRSAWENDEDLIVHEFDRAAEVFERSNSQTEARDEVSRLIRLLPERLRYVVAAHHLDGVAQSKLARRLGLSPSRVSQMLADAVAQLQAIAAAREAAE